MDIDVYLVRHGPTHQTAMTGWTDVPVDLSNTDQITATRALLPETGYMVSSDLQRAVKTADAIAHGFERASHDEALREFNFGDWDGLGFDIIETRSPGALQHYFEHPGETRAPNGESWNDVETRCWAALERHILRAQPQPVVIVAHMGVIMCLLRRAFGIAAYDMMAQKISPLSVSKMERRDGEWRVPFVNALGPISDPDQDAR